MTKAEFEMCYLSLKRRLRRQAAERQAGRHTRALVQVEPTGGKLSWWKIERLAPLTLRKELSIFQHSQDAP